jgi:hypothetical protein
MVQVLQHLPSKYETLSSNSSTEKTIHVEIQVTLLPF